MFIVIIMKSVNKMLLKKLPKKYLYQELKMSNLFPFTMGGTTQFQFATCFRKMISSPFTFAHHCIEYSKESSSGISPSHPPLILLSQENDINKYDITSDW